MSDAKPSSPNRLDAGAILKFCHEMKQWIATEVEIAKQIDKACSEEKNVSSCNAAKSIETKNVEKISEEGGPDAVEPATQTRLAVQHPGKRSPSFQDQLPESCRSSSAVTTHSSPPPLEIIKTVTSLVDEPQQQFDVQSIRSVIGSQGGNEEVSCTSPKEEGKISYLPIAEFGPGDNHAPSPGSDGGKPSNAEEVKKWLSTSPEKSSALDLRAAEGLGLHKCDIDPESGAFMPAVEQPDTYRREGDMSGGSCPDAKWRHSNMTSELQIARELKARDKVLRMLTQHTQTIRPALQEPVQEEVDEWPSAQCSIRPVEAGDFETIADIVNADSGQSSLTLIGETQCVTADDVSTIYERCRSSSMPFIVATPQEEDFLDFEKWPKGSRKVYDLFAAYMKAKPQQAESIVGFAFVSEMAPGLGTISRHLSRFSGMVTVVVHPEHRRKFYGSALLDRILLSISPFHLSLLDYKWECEDPEGIHESPATRNTRQYAKVYVQGFFENQSGAEFKQVAALLDKFEFSQSAYLPRCVRTDEHLESRWLDIAIWECEATPLFKIQDELPQK